MNLSAGPVLPDYQGGWIGAVLPAAATALGGRDFAPTLPLPPAQRVVVVLVDGLGEELLAHTSSAPFLTDRPRRILTASVPSTTATSMGSFGTGLPPAGHGLAGYVVLDPQRDALLNQLRWHPGTDPLRWQPHHTVFERLAAQGISSLALGNPEFAGSGLTRAAHRGADFVGVKRLVSRVDTALSALRDPAGPRLIYLYWGQVDLIGHLYGTRSPRWKRSVAALDRQLRRLAEGAPEGTTVLLTSDHGMVDVAADNRIDLQLRPELRQGVRLIGGEPRLLQLYCEQGAGPEVALRLSQALDGQAWVRTRDEAERQGWFGPVGMALADAVRPRIGDVLVAARGNFTLVDSAVMEEQELKLVGYHGSLTAAEMLIPLVTLTGPTPDV